MPEVRQYPINSFANVAGSVVWFYRPLVCSAQHVLAVSSRHKHALRSALLGQLYIRSLIANNVGAVLVKIRVLAQGLRNHAWLWLSAIALARIRRNCSVG